VGGDVLVLAWASGLWFGFFMRLVVVVCFLSPPSLSARQPFHQPHFQLWPGHSLQRCRVHKLRNVVEHLPKEKRAQAVWRLRGAWAKTTPEEALKELRAVVKWLDTISPSGARSLEEGLEETLTVTRLGLDPKLVRSLHSTNLIESCLARTEAWTSRVKRWRDAKMVMRWGAAALRYAEQGFRRIQGHEQLGQLIQALQANDTKLAPQKIAA
jgi:transposase-like protein